MSIVHEIDAREHLGAQERYDLAVALREQAEADHRRAYIEAEQMMRDADAALDAADAEHAAAERDLAASIFPPDLSDLTETATTK